MDEFDEESIEHFDALSTFHALEAVNDKTSAAGSNGRISTQGNHRSTNFHHKENRINMQEITKNFEYKNEDIRLGQSLSKVESLSSIRDVGCTNPMAHTLWHHPTLNESYQTKQEEHSSIRSSIPTHDDHWTIHENWDLLNRFDSVHEDSKLFEMSSPRFDANNDKDVNDDWNTSSPLFLPLTTTMIRIDGVPATTTAAAAMNVLMDDTATAATTTIDPRVSMTSSIGAHRRQSLPDCVSRPIAVRPFSSSSSSSSLSSEFQSLIR